MTADFLKYPNCNIHNFHNVYGNQLFSPKPTLKIVKLDQKSN